MQLRTVGVSDLTFLDTAWGSLRPIIRPSFGISLSSIFEQHPQGRCLGQSASQIAFQLPNACGVQVARLGPDEKRPPTGQRRRATGSPLDEFARVHVMFTTPATCNGHRSQGDPCLKSSLCCPSSPLVQLGRRLPCAMGPCVNASCHSHHKQPSLLRLPAVFSHYR